MVLLLLISLLLISLLLHHCHPSWLFLQAAPRLCEYTGGLYCRRCHTGRIARLPACALHAWDFTPRPGESRMLCPLLVGVPAHFDTPASRSHSTW